MKGKNSAGLAAEDGKVASVRASRTQWTVFVAAGLLLASAACGSPGDEPPAALNPAPPVRKAFVVSLTVAAQQISQYQMMNGQVPEGDSVAALNQTRMISAPQTDPWGNEVRYHGEGASYTLSSAGPDRRWGTKDDIVIENGELQRP
jgi:hypothetical protein